MQEFPNPHIPLLLSRLPTDVVPRAHADGRSRRQVAKSKISIFVRSLLANVPSANLISNLGLSLTAPDEIRAYLRAGGVVVFLLVGGLGGWAATSSLAGAVIVSGTVVVDSNSKKVQHQSGGIIGEIKVADGDHVNAGDLLIRLDETVTHSNLLVITKQLDEIDARLARLKAERDGIDHIDIAASLQARTNDPEIAAIIAGENTLFESRRKAHNGQKAQLQERVSQLRDEITGLTGQQSANATQLALIQQELKGVEELYAKNLVPLTRVTTLRRDASRLDGEAAQLLSSLAQAKGKIAETELQSIQVDQEFRTEVIKELRDLEGKEAELSEHRVAAEDQLKRIEIRAPQSGVVHQLAVHTVGGVISPGEPIMLIVPDNDALVVEVKVAPQDIDRVHLNQLAFIRFPAFNTRTTPEFNGFVSRISADTTRDPQSNQAYFLVRISLSDAERQRLGKLKLVPGMPADVHIKTSERTALSYFMKPLQEQISKAFREQ
jgi:HlyD family secretion protein